MEVPLRDLTDSAQLEMERARMVRDPYLHGAEEPVRVRYVGGPLDGRERVTIAYEYHYEGEE